MGLYCIQVTWFVWFTCLLSCDHHEVVMGLNSKMIVCGFWKLLLSAWSLLIENVSGFYQSGIKSASDLHRLTSIPLSTIYDNLKRFRKGKSSERAPGSGPHRILESDDRRLLVAQLAVHHPAWSAAKIRNEAMKRGAPAVTTRTIQRTLKDLRYLKLVPKEIPSLNSDMKANWIDWFRRHLSDKCDITIFSDEKIFQFYRTKVKHWTKTGKSQSLHTLSKDHSGMALTT